MISSRPVRWTWRKYSSARALNADFEITGFMRPPLVTLVIIPWSHWPRLDTGWHADMLNLDANERWC
jgi:hypothetical protein